MDESGEKINKKKEKKQPLTKCRGNLTVVKNK